MKLRARKLRYPVPPVGRLESVTVVEEGVAWPLTIITPEDLIGMRSRNPGFLGRPMAASLDVADDGTSAVDIYPPAFESKGEILVRFSPPVVQV